MFENILDPKRAALLKSLVAMDALDAFYLAGGTALSLQLGLRVSLDFDFFTPRHFNADALCALVRERFSSARVLVMERDTCDMLIEDVQVSFFCYPYPTVRPLVQGAGEYRKLRMASPEDIAVMKLSAIGSRGSRKDFYDLYQIYHRIPGFDGERLLSLARARFGEPVDFAYMLMGLGYFDDAEQEVLPKTFVHADWEEIKRFFIEEQRRLFDKEAEKTRREMT